MTATSAPAANECDATCPCRSVTPIADPCSCGMYEKGTRCPFCEVVAGGVTAKQPREQSKAEMLAEYDRRMEAALAANPAVNPARRTSSARRAQEEAGISASAQRATEESTATAEPLGATTTTAATGSRPKGRRPKTQKRTSEQVRRAAKRQMAEREALARKVSPPWLKEQIDAEDAFMETIRNERD